jgi:hypothetical protein
MRLLFSAVLLAGLFGCSPSRGQVTYKKKPGSKLRLCLVEPISGAAMKGKGIKRLFPSTAYLGRNASLRDCHLVVKPDAYRRGRLAGSQKFLVYSGKRGEKIWEFKQGSLGERHINSFHPDTLYRRFKPGGKRERSLLEGR